MRLLLALFFALTAVAYTGFFLSLSNAPFIDAPSHLARAVIMKSLWFDPHSPFQDTFSASRLFMPYMLPDLGFMLVLRMAGVELGYPVWSALNVVVLALAIWFYARQLLATWWAVAAAVFCSWYLATNYMLILGFFATEWGLAAAFVALGALESWRRNKGKASGWIVLYLGACLAAYGAHPACFAILAALVGAIGFLRALRREQSWVRLGWELLPFGILAAYHVLVVPAHPELDMRSMARSTAFNKVGRYFGSIFLRGNYFLDLAILVLFLGIIGAALWASKTQLADARKRWELLTVCALATVGYFLLPIGFGSGWYVDERMLPFVFIPLLMLSLGVLEDSEPSGRQIGFIVIGCGVLAAVNLASLALFLPAQNREVGEYREALRAIPTGRTILPVDTRRADGRTRPLLHAGSLYEVDRAGYAPYLFSAKTGGGPAGYFQDLSSIYRPSSDWYVNHGTADWGKIVETYDYVVITKPWRPERVDLRGLELEYENRVATVFRVRK
jgi:hypothetical protein